MTYRELLEDLKGLPDCDLDEAVFVYDPDTDLEHYVSKFRNLTLELFGNGYQWD